ncbi:MAG TPA: P1 family peptidase [Candidatus Acidoferrales bacterium]|nr:P1 family peptidase [Candidatus Acidoferrales bacterium]
MRKFLVSCAISAALLTSILLLGATLFAQSRQTVSNDSARPRARDLGIRPGIYEPGPLNAITDVSGVRVGQVTIIQGSDVRTGVTAIFPQAGNMFQDKVAGAVYVYNAFGKLVGSAQVNELGQIETPILLTNTLSVWDAAAALTDWMLALPGNENVRSINPVVGETNDGWLNDIRGRHVRAEDVRRALDSAHDGPVEEGTVGAGTGTVAFGWKGGIGTSSRRLPAETGGYTVGVLVQTNFGGHLTIAGVPVYRELQLPKPTSAERKEKRNSADGSCMIVVATDAPLDARQLQRLAKRAILGLALSGSSGSNGSGDFVIAFSTTNRMRADVKTLPPVQLLSEDSLSPLFEAAGEAAEEAIDNSLLRATTVHGRDGHVIEALPIERLKEILASRGIRP